MNNINRCFLFSFKSYYATPESYILVYAEDENNARIIGAKKCFYNSGQRANPNDLILCTFYQNTNHEQQK